MKVSLVIFSLIAAILLQSPAFTEEIVWKSPSGDLSVMDVQPTDSFEEVVNLIKNQIEIENAQNDIQFQNANQGEYLLVFLGAPTEKAANKVKSPFRDYYQPLTAGEIKDIEYIISTLGLASLIKIAKEESSLNKAGDRVVHVHPLQFLKVVFTSEKLKASIYNMQNRGWVWGKFFDGIKRSLEDESNRGNMDNLFVLNFASHVKIDPALITNLIEQRQWKEFINTLITKIPRDGNTERYDM